MSSELGYDGGLTCALPVSDFDASIRWYQDVLGFELAYRIDDMGWAELKSPVERVFVGLSQAERVDPKGGPTLTWGVKDIEKARRTLEQKGVRFDGEIVTYPGMVRLSTFFDPDGHKMMLYQSLGGS